MRVHQEAFAFARDAVQALDPFPRAVVEIGSRSVNGTVRPLFWRAESYVGIDVAGGDGVDVVADGATWRPEQPVDLVVSMEVLEHATDPAAIVANAARMLRQGGHLLITCATDPRAPHSGHDGQAVRDGEHYANVSPDDLADWMTAAGLRADLDVHPIRGDLYALAVRA